MNNRKQYPPDVAIAYRGSYTDKKTGEPATTLKIILKTDLAAGTEIIAFPKKRAKAKDTDPDFGFQLSTPNPKKSGGGGGQRSFSGSKSAAPTRKAPVQQDSFLEDDASEDGSDF